MIALLRGVTAQPTADRLMREFITRVVVGPVTSSVPPDRKTLRTALVASQLIGLSMMCYVLRFDPLASASHEEIVATVAPALQQYLTGDLGSMVLDS